MKARGLALCTILCLAAVAYADDAIIGSESLPVEFSLLGIDANQQATHNDDSPFKGWAFVTVKNTGTQPWGDFHFEIVGLGIENVSFLDSTMTAYAGGAGFDPISSQNGLSWTINNTVVGATLDLYFYSDPVMPGSLATFQVYTDNTQDQNSFFGLMIYPTPVPEPATLAFLGLSGLALLRRRK